MSSLATAGPTRRRAPRLVLPSGAPRPVWLAERRNGIGSSDIAALLGLSPYASPYSVWADKLTAKDEPEPTDGPMYWGTVLEEPIALHFARRNDAKIRRHGLIAHPYHDWARATPDRIARVPDMAPGPVEIKKVHDRARDEWSGDTDDPDAKEAAAPPAYVAQLQWQLGIGGWSGGWLAGLVGGSWFHQVRFEFDPMLFDDMLAVADPFWNINVLGGIPPAIDGHRATTAALKSLEANPGESRILDVSEVAPILAERQQVRDELAAAKERSDRVDNQLRALIGNAEVAVWGEQTLFTYKTTKAGHRRLYVPKARATVKEAA
jgi:putative phage-type endonuclease